MPPAGHPHPVQVLGRHGVSIAHATGAERNRQETIIPISAPNSPTDRAASSLTFADLPEGLALTAQGFVKPGRLLIDGAWVEAVSGKTFDTFNPATEESLGHVAHGAAEDIEL